MSTSKIEKDRAMMELEFTPSPPSSSRDESCSPSVQPEEKIEEPKLEEDFSLPPIDGGKAAWMFLVGSTVVDAVVWGMIICYGNT